MTGKRLIRQVLHMAKDSWYVHCMEKKSLDKKCILLESKNGEEAGSNILYMLRALSREEYKEYKIYLAVNKEKISTVQKLLDRYAVDNTKIVERYGLFYFQLLATAGYLVTDTTFPKRFIKREGQVYMNTWHGTSFKKLGKDTPDGAYAMGNVQRNLLMADYIVSPSAYALKKLSDAHDLEGLYQGSYVLAGYPRNQAFFMEGEREALRKSLGLEGKRIYCYMPTWRGVVRDRDALKESQRQAEEIKKYLNVLDRELKEEEVFYVRLHPFAGKDFNCDEYRHIRLFPDGIDVYGVLSLADVLVTDYSSVFFDYANKKEGKTILFLYDRENFKESRDYYLDLNSLPFPIAETAEELLEQLRSPKEYDSEEFCRRYCTCDGENAAQELCRFLLFGETGEKISVKKAESGKKKNILFYVGGLRRNGLTTSFLNLMEYVKESVREAEGQDLAKKNGEGFQYFAAFQEEYLKDTPKRVEILPGFLKLLPMSPGWNLTWEEAAASYLFYKKNIDNGFVRKYLDRFYEREYRRNFGGASFEWCIHFTGYERKVIGLFGKAPGKKGIFVHNDMLREIETRGNQHLLTLKRAYREYDMVLAVSRDIYERTLKISGKKENLHVVNNCHAYKQVLKRAEEEISFDETTRCTVSLKELKRRLEQPVKKFITIGRFSPEKGHAMLLEAFSRYHEENTESMLIIIGGGGELYDETLRKVENLGLTGAVTLLFSVENPMPILKKCDLFILSSLYEGLGLVLLEADTLEIPVLSTDVVGPRGFMREHGGTLVPPDVSGLLSGMQAFDRGEVKALHVDYEAYNQRAVNEFLELL